MAREQKRETRIRVLRAAGRQLRELGVERVGIARVMAEAGLTHGGFYAHFESRDELLRATVEQMFLESPSALLSSPEGAPRDVLRRFFDYYLSVEHRDTRAGGCPLPFLTADAPRLGVELRELLADSCGKLARLLAQQLVALGRPDAETEAGCCVAEVIGALVLARADPDAARSAGWLQRSRTSLFQRFGLDVNAGTAK